MAHFPHGSFVAIHAAQEEQRRIEKEEEEMTKYSTEDLEKDWEFKIVRSSSSIFRKPEVFQALLEEEAFSGWELVEKLDDRRVRFKRRREARRRDATLPPGIDPYRTQYGGGDARLTAIMVGLIIAVALGVLVGFVSSAGTSGNGSSDFPLIATMIPAIIGLMGIVAVIFTRRRGR